jgi:tyrosyl-tRNA synthetase
MSEIIKDPEVIDEILSRSVVEVLPSKDLLKKELMSGRQLKIYIGADPTGTALHLGHATNYIILERLRKLGHKIIVLFGDFTAMIGDPSDKLAVRKQLSREEVLHNTKNWIEQLSPVIDFSDKDNPVEVMYNYDWLSKMTFEDVVGLASNFTVQRMLERDMFEKRMKEKKPIYVHEFFYPLMQGYDSVHLEVDVEMCGNDQKFNALCGRTLLKKYKNKEKFVFITTLLENPVTKEKMMSKSLGTGVFLDASNTEMYGQIMSQTDENILQLFTDCTLVPLSEIEEIGKKLKKDEVNPRDLKMKLAYEIVSLFRGEKEAEEAQNYFVNTFQKKETPDDIKEFGLAPGDRKLVELLLELDLANSKSEARRLIEQGGVKFDGEVLKGVDDILKPKDGMIIQKGKRSFAKIKLV